MARNPREVCPPDLTLWDPLRRRLLCARPSPILWGLVVCILLTTLRALCAYLDGFFVTKGAVRGFVNDPSVYTNFVFGCVVFSYYFWIPSGIAGVVNGLVGNRVFSSRTSGHLPIADPRGKPSRDTKRLRKQLLDSYKSKRHPILLCIIVIGILLLLGSVYRGLDGGAWYTAGRWGRLAAQVWGTMLMGAIFSVGLACVVLIRVLRGAFRKLHPNIRPSHPDGVGGLRPLGEFSLRLVYFLSIVGVMLLGVTPFTRGLTDLAQPATTQQGTTTGAAGVLDALSYSLSYELVIAAVVYALAAPALFFLVLGTASNAMRRAKERLLRIISDGSDVLYRESLIALQQSQVEELKPAIKRLMAVRELDDATRSFPVWPFDGQSIRRFLGSYFSPLTVGLLIELILRVLDGLGTP